jgi:hypothetical protein
MLSLCGAVFAAMAIEMRQYVQRRIKGDWKDEGQALLFYDTPTTPARARGTPGTRTTKRSIFSLHITSRDIFVVGKGVAREN